VVSHRPIRGVAGTHFSDAAESVFEKRMFFYSFSRIIVSVFGVIVEIHKSPGSCTQSGISDDSLTSSSFTKSELKIS
jgi:hypothetical protein